MKTINDLLLSSPVSFFCRVRRALAICAAGIFFLGQASAQSYFPGGLGNTHLNLWLTASDVTTLINPSGSQAASGDYIAEWKDKSGAGAHALQSTGGLQPIEQAGLLNGNAGVEFQNANEFLSGASGAYQTIVAVRSMPGTGHYQTLFASPANTDFSIRGGGAGTIYTDGPNGNDWPNNTGTTPTQWINGAQSLNGSSTNHILVTASANPTNSSYSINSTFSGRGMNGNDPIFEVLSYNTTLNTTQRRIVENYEASEWGLTALLPNSAYTIFTPPSSSTYNQNLVGIGYTSSTDNFLANPAGSTDGLGFSSGSGGSDFLNTAGYLMAAHNGQANTSMTGISIAGIGTNLNRWDRSWYLQKNGGNAGGNITLNFSFSDYNGGTLPGGVSNYYLLYNSTDGSFASGANTIVAVSGSASGSIASFTVGAGLIANGYYTIVWSSPTTQLITPAVATVCSGGNTAFTALTSSGFTYQWQVNDGSGFSNVPAADPGGAAYSGSTTASLSITGVTASMNGYTYQCILTPSSGPTVILGPSTLDVNASPVVGTITGISSVGLGNTTALTDTTTGGTWTSSFPAVATVNSSGLVTGQIMGATTITYSVTNASGCSASSTLSISVISQQYYPGGLGNTNLNLWLTAADARTLENPSGGQAASGDYVATWIDKSGAGANATQGNSGMQPVEQTGLLNGYAGVVFQNIGEYLAGISGAYQTVVAVRGMPGTGTWQTLFASPANTDFSIRNGGAGSNYTASPPNGNDWVYNTGATPTQWINGIQSLSGSSANHILVAAAASPTNNTYSISSTFMNRGMNGNDQVFELLSYNTTLNTTQRRILENYEGSEWGLTTLLPASGYTVFTPPSASTYNQNLVGIGYTSGTDYFLANPVGASNGSTDGLSFSSGSGATDFLNTAGYLMAADNGQANTVLTNVTVAGISGTSLSRWNRSWYLQMTGGNSTGHVTLNFNFYDYNFGALPSTTYTYSILYNATDGSFATGTNQLITTLSTTVSASNVAFDVNAAYLPNGYYTLIWNAPTTLALVLTSFEVTKEESGSLLQWTASGEDEGDWFEIQRGTDSAAYSGIGMVAAGGDSSMASRYNFTDGKPASGWNYYRLKIENPDGSNTYSAVRPVYFGVGHASSISVYPNPVTDILYINFSNTPATVVIRVINARGQVIKTVNAGGSNTVSVPVSGLAKGVYFIEINTGGSDKQVFTISCL